MTEDNPAHHGAVDDMAAMDHGVPPSSDPHKAADTPSEVPAEDEDGLEPRLPDGGPCVTDGPAHENQAEAAQPHGEERGNQKKVTFILEPELINDSVLSESNTSCESQAESSFSGEMYAAA